MPGLPAVATDAPHSRSHAALARAGKEEVAAAQADASSAQQKVLERMEQAATRAEQSAAQLTVLDDLKAKSVDLEMASCGFMPEQYEKANGEVEKGFYVRLPDDGVPLEPEEFGGENSRVRVVTPDEAAAMGMLGGDGPPS